MPVAFLLWAERTALDEAERRLAAVLGPVLVRGPDRAFDATRYYEPEMGPGLRRRLVAFGELLDPGFLVDAKLRAVSIEGELRGDGGRRVNIDPGYLDRGKLVLASTKLLGRKVWLGRGVAADIAGLWEHGRLRPLEWTFPDLRRGTYDDEFAAARRAYLEELRSGGRRAEGREGGRGGAGAG